MRDAPGDLVPEWCRACCRLAEQIEHPALVVRFRLNPDEAIVFDNLRVLHARAAITDAGSRHLQGCHADRDGLRSTIAMLEAMAAGLLYVTRTSFD